MKYLTRLNALYRAQPGEPAPPADVPSVPGKPLRGALLHYTSRIQPEEVDVSLALQKMPRAARGGSALLERAHETLRHRDAAARLEQEDRWREELRQHYADVARYPERGPRTSDVDAAFWARLHRLEHNLRLPLTVPSASHTVEVDNNAPLPCVPREPQRGAAPVDAGTQEASEAPGYYGRDRAAAACPTTLGRRATASAARDTTRTMRELAAARLSLANQTSAQRFTAEPVTTPAADVVRRARAVYEAARGAHHE